MTEEVWRDVVTHPGIYEVSNLGRVRSVARKIWICASAKSSRGYYRGVAERILRHTLAKRGSYVSLWSHHEMRAAGVHVLVLEAFVGPRPDGYYGCHDDGNCRNNSASNLYWGTPSQNGEDKIRHGTWRDGENIPWAKLRQTDVEEIRRLRGKETQASLAVRFGVGQNQISRVQLGKQWRGQSKLAVAA